MAAVFEWSIPVERREAALVAFQPRGPDALESETTTGAAVPLLDEGGTQYTFFVFVRFSVNPIFTHSK